MQHQITFDATSEAHRLLTHKIAHELTAVTPPFLQHKNCSQAAHLSESWATAGLAPSTDQLAYLQRSGGLHPLHRHQLRAKSIQQLLRRRCCLNKGNMKAVVDRLNLQPLSVLAKDAATIAIALPELISLALQGRIASAVAVVPSISIDVGEGYNPEQIMDVIGEITSYHVMICLLAEARRTHAALYSPTGLPVLDNHGGQRPVPLAFTGKTIMWNADQFIAVQRLYGIGRELTAGEQALIDQYEGIRDHAQRFETEWRAIYGDSFPAFLAETVAKSSLWTRYIRMQVGRATKSGGRNASLYKFQQSDPLGDFWLSCRMAIAWLGFPATRKRTLENAFNTSRLTEALSAIKLGEAIAPPSYADANLFDTRCLFFLLRALIVNDCYVGGRRSAASPMTRKEAVQKIERAIDANPALDPLRTDYEDHGAQRFGAHSSVQGPAVELLPSMWVKLHS